MYYKYNKTCNIKHTQQYIQNPANKQNQGNLVGMSQAEVQSNRQKDQSGMGA